MKKYKVFMIGYSHNKGGVEAYIRNLHQHIDTNRYEFIYSMPEMIIDGKRWVRPINRHNYIKYYLFWKHFYKENKFDVVYLNTCDIVSIDDLRFAKAAGVPVRIIHSHSTGNQQAIRSKMNLFHRLCEKRSRRDLPSIATNQFACSDDAGQWMFKDGTYKVIKNGINIKKYQFNDYVRNTIRSSYELGDKSLIGIIGRLDPVKNTFFSLKLFETLNNIDNNYKLVFIGDGEERKEAEKYVLDRALDDRILFIGAVENVNEWMSAIDCLVMPSLFEGLPFVLVEAQAAGVPCVVSIGVSEEANLTGLVQFLSLEESKETWAAKVLEAAVAPEQRKDTTQQLIDAGYSMEATANRVSEIIEKALTK